MITDLRKTYPKDKMEEISTSFCFICLLHLANERGLKLEVDNKVEDDMEDDDTDAEASKVGNLWDLKVCFLPLQLQRRAHADILPFCRYTGIPTRRSLHSDTPAFSLYFTRCPYTYFTRLVIRWSALFLFLSVLSTLRSLKMYVYAMPCLM